MTNFCKMIEWNSHETHNIQLNLNATPLSSTPLNDQQQFVLNKNNEIKYYFVTEIKERESMSKRLSDYIASSDYFDKSIASFVTVIGAPV